MIFALETCRAAIPGGMALALLTLIDPAVIQAQDAAEPSNAGGQDATSTQPASPAVTTIVPLLGQPLGTIMTVAGVVFDDDTYGSEGTKIRVQSINGQATQKDLEILVDQCWPPGPATWRQGQSYELEGIETGHFGGIPVEAFRRGNFVIQGLGGFRFVHHFLCYKNHATAPIVYRLHDLIGQRVLVTGKAVNLGNVATLTGPDWTLALSAPPWEDWQVDKDA